ncbi:MAG: hypothetical protein ACRDP9_25870 [Kribbellaceae bacterium]
MDLADAQLGDDQIDGVVVGLVAADRLLRLRLVWWFDEREVEPVAPGAFVVDDELPHVGLAG